MIGGVLGFGARNNDRHPSLLLGVSFLRDSAVSSSLISSNGKSVGLGLEAIASAWQ